ncbi:MAG: sugar ABC transporter substrate-binding protein [Candidatus Sumerlaeota bacterium]|nr:sugar ABC transporter substrate-binding protein [Candidatus Sumerlaeota bacterium]
MNQAIFVASCRLIALGAAFLCISGCARRTDAGDVKGKVTVTWMVAVDFTRDLIQELADKFNSENPRVHLKIAWVPGPNYQAKLKTLIAAGEAPDLFYCGDVWVAYLMPFLYDISGFVQRDASELELDDFYPQLIEACKHNGRFYFLPRWFNVSLLYYNRGIFREAGVGMPTADWKWDDYLRAGEKLTKRGSSGKVGIWGSTISPFWWGEWLTLVRQAGGDMFNPDITRCTLGTPEAIQGMQFYYDKIYKYGISPPPGLEPDKGFASNKMAMEFGGHTGNWITYNAIPGIDWDIEVLPAGPRTRCGGELAIDALGVSLTTRYPEAAWEAVKFMASKHSIRRHAEKGYLSVRKSIAKEILYERAKTQNPHNIKAAYHALDFAVPIPRSPDFIELALEIIQPDIDDMITRGLNPPAVCRQVTKAADAYLNVVALQKRAP